MAPVSRTGKVTEEVLLRRGVRLMKEGEYQRAARTFRQGIEEFPHEWRFHCDLATALRLQGRVSGALRELRRALELAPEEAFPHQKMGAWLMEIGQVETAIAMLERAVHLAGQSTSSRLQLVVMYMEAKQIEQALELAEAVVSDEPEHADAHALLGLIQGMRGKDEESLACLRRALSLDPGCPQAAYHLSRRGEDFDPEPLMARLRELPRNHEDFAKLSFALGNLHDRRDEPGAAFAHYARANANVQTPWTPQHHTDLARAIVATCRRETYTARSARPSSEPAPIFIVGLPRTGSTLLERILGEHPQVQAVGEHALGIPRLARSLGKLCPDAGPYPVGIPKLTPSDQERLAAMYRESLPGGPSDRHPCDKLLANFQTLGLIALLFPDAKVINCRRDPRDSGLSAFFLQFQRNEMPWTYNRGHIADYYRDYAQLMEHWSEHLPIPIFDVRYEDLVEDPELWTRKTLDYLELPWDDRCLSFHGQERTVFTASAFQVREKPHRRAVARWRKYAPFLGPLAEIAREWGYPE